MDDARPSITDETEITVAKGGQQKYLQKVLT